MFTKYDTFGRVVYSGLMSSSGSREDLQAAADSFNIQYEQRASGRSDNPIENTTIKNEKRTINYNLLESEELEELYYNFETDKYQEEYHKYTLKRAKVIIGLIVYQGMNTTDLGNRKTEHLQLNKGKIYVPSTKRSNARELKLKPCR